MKIVFSFLLSISAFAANSQTAVTSIQENFDADCVLATSFPSHWLTITPVAGTVPDGQWTCAPTGGRPTSTGSPTAGISCTSVYGTPTAIYNLDTSYLITPLLNLSGYSPGHVYLRFDSKVTKIDVSGGYHIVTSQDSDFHSSLDTDLTGTTTPLIGAGDSSGWVTHEIDLSSFENLGNFYLAFRYIGSTTSGSTWYLDNINTTTIGLHVPGIPSYQLPLTVVGQSTSSQITIAFSSPPDAGTYHLSIYDMVGREVHSQILNTTADKFSYTISGLQLMPGVYCVKLASGNRFGIVRALVQ